MPSLLAERCANGYKVTFQVLVDIYMKKVFGSLLLLLLASCAAPVGTFSQKQVSSNQFEIQLIGQFNIPRDQVWINWIYRCAELTKEKGYSYFSLADPTTIKVRPASSGPAPQALAGAEQQQVNRTSIDRPAMRSAVYRADDPGPHFLKVAGKGGGFVSVPVYGPGATVYAYQDDMLITMYSDPLPLEAGAVLRAQTIIDAYGAYVESHGKAMLADTRKDVVERATVVSPLRTAYNEYLLHLIVTKRPPLPPTVSNFEDAAKLAAPTFPLTDNWRPVGSEANFVNPDSVVGEQGTIHYVLARGMGAGGSFQFFRIKADCSSGSTEVISSAVLESGTSPRKVSELETSDARVQLPVETLKQSSAVACQLADLSLKPALGVVPLDFPWGSKWTALKYTGGRYGVSETFLENHIQVKLDDTIIVRGAWLTDSKGPKVYTVNWFHVDCAAKKYGVTHWGTGNWVTAQNNRLITEGKDDNPAMQDIFPGTFQADLLELACQRARTMQAAQD
jgi:hypothetical protein